MINETELTELVNKIKAEFDGLTANIDGFKIKAQARRARKHTLSLEKLFKTYRKISIK